MKCWNTMPTPAAIASAGECRVTWLPVDLDRAGVRRLHAVEDLHQRRLAGAVLPDDRVDGAAPDVDVDVVVGDHAREALADPAQPHGDGRTGLGGSLDCRCRHRLVLPWRRRTLDVPPDSYPTTRRRERSGPAVSAEAEPAGPERESADQPTRQERSGSGRNLDLAAR